MDWLAVVVIGGIMGGLSTLGSDSPQAFWLPFLAGIAGALCGRWLFADVLGMAALHPADAIDFTDLLFGALGAAILLAILRVLRLPADTSPG